MTSHREFCMNTYSGSTLVPDKYAKLAEEIMLNVEQDNNTIKNSIQHNMARKGWFHSIISNGEEVESSCGSTVHCSNIQSMNQHVIWFIH